MKNRERETRRERREFKRIVSQRDVLKMLLRRCLRATALTIQPPFTMCRKWFTPTAFASCEGERLNESSSQTAEQSGHLSPAAKPTLPGGDRLPSPLSGELPP